MKKLLMASLFALVTTFSFAQEKPYYDGQFLHINLENGVGVEQKLKFSLKDEDYNKIKESLLFKNWKQTTWSNPQNANFIEKNKDIDDVVVYLKGHLTMCKFDLKFTKLKNGSSLEFIDNSKGLIYLSQDGGIRISFPFKSQNGYGNSIVANTIYSIDSKDGKESTYCYVYTN